MVRQRQADLLLVAATVIAACGWIFSREAIAGMPVFAFLGLRFFFCGAAAAAVLSRLPRGEATLAADDDRRAVVCAEPVSVDLLGLDHRLAGRGGVHHEPVDAVCAAHRMGDDENTPGPGILGVPAGRDRRPRAAESAYADCLPPQPGWFLLTALVQSIWFCYTSRCARDVPLIPLTTVQLAITGLVGLGISAAVETWDQPFTLPTFGWLLASIVIATSLRFGLQMKGQKYAAVASAAIIMVLEPLLTVIAAALWYGEQLPLQKIIGGMLILVAQLWFRWRMLRPLR